MKQSNRNPFNPSTNLRRSAFFAEPCTLQAPQLEASFNGIEIDRPLSAPSPLKPADIEALKEILEKLPGRPRVTLHHPDGRIEEVSEKNTPGLDEAAKSSAGDAELPESGTFFAWQNCDDAHPAEGGAAGYRIVYKMVRTIATPMLDLVGPNFRIRIGNDSVRYGETIFRNSMTWKHSDTFLVPEWGALATQGDPLSYTPFPPPRIDIEGKEDETPPCNHVEILLALNLPPDTGYSDHLREGRMKLAPMIAALDLLYGVRLLGPIITEEIGAVFDDWHWNRKLGGRQFLYEPQARLKYLPTTLFMEAFEVFSELHRERDDKDRWCHSVEATLPVGGGLIGGVCGWRGWGCRSVTGRRSRRPRKRAGRCGGSPVIWGVARR